MFWLTYRPENTPCVMIVRAGFLVAARLRASMAVDGIDTQFVEGHELPPAAAKNTGWHGRAIADGSRGGGIRAHNPQVTFGWLT